MSKALFGYLGEPRSYVMLKQLGELRARVSELEVAMQKKDEALQAAEAELLHLRAVAAELSEKAEVLA